MDEYNPWITHLSYANQLSCYENILVELTFKHTLSFMLRLLHAICDIKLFILVITWNIIHEE